MSLFTLMASKKTFQVHYVLAFALHRWGKRRPYQYCTSPVHKFTEKQTAKKVQEQLGLRSRGSWLYEYKYPNLNPEPASLTAIMRNREKLWGQEGKYSSSFGHLLYEQASLIWTGISYMNTDTVFWKYIKSYYSCVHTWSSIVNRRKCHSQKM